MQHVALGWWNTGISPNGRPCANHAEKMGIAQQVIQQLTRSGVAFLGLTEVTGDDLHELCSGVMPSGYRSIAGTEHIGKAQFDIGVLYNAAQISILDKKFLVTRQASTTLKVAFRVDLLPHPGEQPFHVFLSYWPSRLYYGEKHPKRSLLGMELRNFINSVARTPAGEQAYVIVMGDFNDEPFDASLADHLLATRDRGMVSRKRDLLYNPFWRHLGEHTAFIPGSPMTDNLGGTYFYHKGELTRWRTFDQMLFSARFITSAEWVLDERYSVIWNAPPLHFDSFKGCGFDHLPIISMVVFTSHIKE